MKRLVIFLTLLLLLFFLQANVPLDTSNALEVAIVVPNPVKADTVLYDDTEDGLKKLFNAHGTCLRKTGALERVKSDHFEKSRGLLEN